MQINGGVFWNCSKKNSIVRLTDVRDNVAENVHVDHKFLSVALS